MTKRRSRSATNIVCYTSATRGRQGGASQYPVTAWLSRRSWVVIAARQSARLLPARGPEAPHWHRHADLPPGVAGLNSRLTTHSEPKANFRDASLRGALRTRPSQDCSTRPAKCGAALASKFPARPPPGRRHCGRALQCTHLSASRVSKRPAQRSHGRRRAACARRGLPRRPGWHGRFSCTRETLA